MGDFGEGSCSRFSFGSTEAGRIAEFSAVLDWRRSGRLCGAEDVITEQ